MIYLSLILIVIISLNSLSCRKSKFDSELFKIKFAGEKRCYLLHIPENFNAKGTKSLIIALHGGLGSPRNVEEQSGLSQTSDSEGFIVCYPQGLNKTWNAGECCGKAVKKDRDDVGFISFLIDELLANYDIDPNRVYVTGMSNGGFMCYRLACEIPNKIFGIAPVSATMAAKYCNPTGSTPIIHFHSYNDSNVPYQGGVGDGPSKSYKAPLDSVFTVWNTLNNCATTKTLVYDGTDYDRWTWSNCSNGFEMELYMTHDGGHQWPMGVKSSGKSDDPSIVINANILMWEFFKKFW